jgi:hypothetical protein
MEQEIKQEKGKAKCCEKDLRRDENHECRKEMEDFERDKNFYANKNIDQKHLEENSLKRDRSRDYINAENISEQ